MLIFLAFNGGTDAAHGWGVVMSTDTAFLVGILALFGPKCPDRLRLFLLTLAIVDDIGAITVMSIFYTDEVDMAALALAAAIVVGILVLRWLKVWQLAPYVVAGIALWFAVQASGVHATLAGVIVGLLVPARPAGPARRSTRSPATGASSSTTPPPSASTSPSWPRGPRSRRATGCSASCTRGARSSWCRCSAWPTRGSGSTWSPCRPPRTSRLAIGVAVALVLGNAIGITGAATLAIRLGLGELPGRVRWGHLLGGAVLAGIGFTISLFIAELAFDDPQQLEDAKIGILAGSLTAAVLGSVLLRWLGEKLPLCSPLSDAPPPLPPLPWRAPGGEG